MLKYRCRGCRRIFTRRECVLRDDPMAPFGPERVCPDCGSLVTLYVHPVAAVALAFLAAIVGFSAGWLLSR